MLQMGQPRTQIEAMQASCIQEGKGDMAHIAYTLQMSDRYRVYTPYGAHQLPVRAYREGPPPSVRLRLWVTRDQRSGSVVTKCRR